MACDRAEQDLRDLGRVTMVEDGMIELETKLTEPVLRRYLQTKFYAIQSVRFGPEYNVVRLSETGATVITRPLAEPSESRNHPDRD